MTCVCVPKRSESKVDKLNVCRKDKNWQKRMIMTPILPLAISFYYEKKTIPYTSTPSICATDQSTPSTSATDVLAPSACATDQWTPPRRFTGPSAPSTSIIDPRAPSTSATDWSASFSSASGPSSTSRNVTDLSAAWSVSSPFDRKHKVVYRKRQFKRVWNEQLKKHKMSKKNMMYNPKLCQQYR